MAVLQDTQRPSRSVVAVRGGGTGLPVLWTDGGVRPHVSRYAVGPGAGNVLLEALHSSPRPPRVVTTDDLAVDPRTGPGLHLAYRVLLLPLWELLVGGPAPRRATRWAWFWVGAVLPAAWLAFLVLEPAPLVRSSGALPRHPRVTAGWALLAALLVSAVLAALLPAGLADALLVR